MLLLSLPPCHDQAQALAQSLGVEHKPIALHTFPDGEALLRLPLPLAAHTVIFSSLPRPDAKLIRLLLAARTARQHPVGELSLLAPYLCYMRQDQAFHPGEAVSQNIIGRFLDDLFDRVITVDPHLHRTASLEQIMPTTAAVSLSAAPLISDFLRQQAPAAILLGPDSESLQWVQQVAVPLGADYGVCSKQRQGDAQVRIQLPPLNFTGREVVLVDDIVSTGTTLLRTAQALRAAGAARVACFATHALIAEDRLTELYQGGIDRVWSSDSVPHPSNAVCLNPLYRDFFRSLDRR